MTTPQGGDRRPQALKGVDRHGMIFIFLPCPQKAEDSRGHNPNNTYATWRNPMRDARRQVGWPSGRQWRKFRKFGQKAYRAYQEAQTMGGIIDPAPAES